VDEDKVKVNFCHGVLCVEFEKLHTSKRVAKKLTITTGKD
jgi:HSP20 family molecular chaperone IbpA